MKVDLKTFEPTLLDLRKRFERAFKPDTAASGFPGTTPSTGQCAAVSVVLATLLGVGMVSTRVNGLSHWFNRIRFGGAEYDFDLTGDQFGLSSVRHGLAGELYVDTKIRRFEEVNSETLGRARLLALRAGLQDVARQLERAP